MTFVSLQLQNRDLIWGHISTFVILYHHVEYATI
jgi:hypothetical protein